MKHKHYLFAFFAIILFFALPHTSWAQTEEDELLTEKPAFLDRLWYGGNFTIGYNANNNVKPLRSSSPPSRPKGVPPMSFSSPPILDIEPAVIFVKKNPGQILYIACIRLLIDLGNKYQEVSVYLLTLIPYLPHSAAKDLVKFNTAPFEVLYAIVL